MVPVYNEQASIPRVVQEWMDELSKWSDSFAMLAIDDGSRDASLEILRGLQQQFGGRLLVHARANRGHGYSCLEGYRQASKLGARWVFQIDSDGQCDPQYFGDLWRQRDSAAVVYGVRKRRDDGFPRVVVSRVLRLVLLLGFGVNCPDANVPYRLMKTDAVMWAVNQVPEDFHLANVALAALLAKDPRCSHEFVPIGFRRRYGGEPSVKPFVFGRKGLELYRDMRKMFREADEPA